MTQLIITEKPSSAEKIALALSDKKPEKKVVNKISYYKIKHNNKDIIIVSAVGHLYTVAEKNKEKWTYPIFDIEWKESYKVNKESGFTKPYLDLIKKLCKDVDSFVVATDYDIEGEVIGLNIVKYACKQKDALRMKFSTLTKDELISSYKNASKHLNWPQAEAGRTRHELDWFWGINLSRALTLAIKNAGMFKIMSSGRVQGPSLKILADREREIKKFKPIQFWQIEFIGTKDKKEINAFHKENKFWDKEKAKKVLEKTEGKKAFIDKVEKKQFEQSPPNPFDLTALQLEAYKTLGISPKETLSLAQNLYSSTYISYPRTSSNQLPESVNYKKILTLLSKQTSYKNLCDELLKGKLKPNNGNKKDPAHPAIYPTGEVPKKLTEREKRLYDLIVKRTLATFSIPAVRETIKVDIDINKEIFIVKGTRTIKEGWHKFYQPYIMLKEEELPEMKKSDEIKVKKIIFHEKETQPPKRYTQASIIKELEKRSLGTKATRAAIIDSLYDRNYIKEKSIETTNLGIKTIETLEKFCPEILDESLTKHFEKDMDKIQEKKKKSEAIIKEAKIFLEKTLKNFKQNEEKIGKLLLEASVETREQENIVGICPSCKNNLKITYSKKNKSYFIACSSYPECTVTFSLPNYAKPIATKKECPECKFPLVKMIRKGKRPYDYCINQNCPKKKEWIEKQKEDYAI